MKKTVWFILFLTSLVPVAPFDLIAQSENTESLTKKNYLNITDERGRKIKFNLKGDAKFEITNGAMNIAILSDKNKLFQITGISENAIKDTSLKSKAFRMTFISSPTEKSYVSNQNNIYDILIIKCRSQETGSPLAITLKGKVYQDRKYYSINAFISGKIPEKKFISNQKN